MTRIIITKSYTLDNGDISGMFRIPAEKATKAARHTLVDLEGLEAIVEPAKPDNEPQGEPITVSDILAAIVRNAHDNVRLSAKLIEARKAECEAARPKETGLPFSVMEAEETTTAQGPDPRG